MRVPCAWVCMGVHPSVEWACMLPRGSSLELCNTPWLCPGSIGGSRASRAPCHTIVPSVTSSSEAGGLGKLPPPPLWTPPSVRSSSSSSSSVYSALSAVASRSTSPTPLASLSPSGASPAPLTTGPRAEALAVSQRRGGRGESVRGVPLVGQRLVAMDATLDGSKAIDGGGVSGGGGVIPRGEAPADPEKALSAGSCGRIPSVGEPGAPSWAAPLAASGPMGASARERRTEARKALSPLSP